MVLLRAFHCHTASKRFLMRTHSSNDLVDTKEHIKKV